eukprot:7381554-Prymnesium_polylepis.2
MQQSLAALNTARIGRAPLPHSRGLRRARGLRRGAVLPRLRGRGAQRGARQARVGQLSGRHRRLARLRRHLSVVPLAERVARDEAAVVALERARQPRQRRHPRAEPIPLPLVVAQQRAVGRLWRRAVHARGASHAR